eukprot:1160679-Pelagomonas_calceolata.AAC.9
MPRSLSFCPPPAVHTAAPHTPPWLAALLPWPHGLPAPLSARTDAPAPMCMMGSRCSNQHSCTCWPRLCDALNASDDLKEYWCQGFVML